MTVRELIQTIDVMDHYSEAKHSDGSNPKDEFQVIVHMKGHGKLTEATVSEVTIARGMMFIRVNGTKTSKEETRCTENPSTPR